MNDNDLKENKQTLSTPVYNLQIMLRDITALNNTEKLIPDGYFDEKTEDAVILIQNNSGLTADGKVDFVTFTEIRTLYINGGNI